MRVTRGGLAWKNGVMRDDTPEGLRHLIHDELHSGSGLGGGVSLWRSVVLAVDVAGDVAAALLWQRGGVVASALFEYGDGQWWPRGGGAQEGCRHREIFTGRPSAETAGPAGFSPSAALLSHGGGDPRGRSPGMSGGSQAITCA
jgi:hypothetical protein